MPRCFCKGRLCECSWTYDGMAGVPWGHGMGRVPSTPHSQLLPSMQVSHLFQAVSAGVARGESTVKASLTPSPSEGWAGESLSIQEPHLQPSLSWLPCHYSDPSSSSAAVLTAGPTEDPAAADHHAHH